MVHSPPARRFFNGSLAAGSVPIVANACHSCRRWLRRAARREPWSPATHADFPPAYRRAARALLLAARRHKGLGSLPQGALQHVLGLAAYPLSAWRPCEK